MKKVTAACSLIGFATAFVLTGSTLAKGAQPSFKVMHPDELAKLIASKDPKLFLYDANDRDFRVKEGIIPGAKLLSSFKGYDVGKELPAAKDAKLVFYCANTH